MINGKILRDGINNETICEMTSVEKIKKFFREHRLRWFGHIEKMDNEKAPVNAKSFVVHGSKRDKL